MAAAKRWGSGGAVLPGWLVECFQATAGPIMLGGIPQNLLFLLGLPSIFGFLLYPKILIGTGAAYAVAFCGTMWEPFWFAMLREYFSYKTHYEG
jgi:hypothetical protein